MIERMIERMRFIINYLDTWMNKIQDFADMIVDRLVLDSRYFFGDYMKINPSVEEKESTQEYEYFLK